MKDRTNRPNEEVLRVWYEQEEHPRKDLIGREQAPPKRSHVEGWDSNIIIFFSNILLLTLSMFLSFPQPIRWIVTFCYTAPIVIILASNTKAHAESKITQKTILIITAYAVALGFIFGVFPRMLL